MNTSAYTELDLHTSPIDEGLTVIEASAGTGKTYSISHLVPRLLLSGVLPDVSKLLLVTFTNDAARELADRVRRVLARLASPPTEDEAAQHPGVAALRVFLHESAAERRLQQALLDLDLLAVSTIHAFCQRTLQAEGSLCGVPVMPEVITDDAAYSEPLVRDEWLRRLATDPVLAALAIAQDWSLAETQKVVETLRKVGGVECVQPTPEPFASVRQRLETELNRLQADSTRVELDGCLTAAGWKGNASLELARATLQRVAASAPTTCEFWESLAFFAVDLDGKLGQRGQAQKNAAAAVLGCSWVRTAQQVMTTARQLLWSLQVEVATSLTPRLAASLEAHRLITQDGLIAALYHALHRPGDAGTRQSQRLADHLADKYHVALVDESQDTDPRQFAIFERIFLTAQPRRRLILVGDPKQAIYGFRGADVATYLGARDGADRIYTLTRTHRAPQPLVSAVNAFFQRPGAFHHPGMIFRPAQSALAYDRELVLSGQSQGRLEVWLAGAGQPEFSRSRSRVRALSQRVAATIVDLLEAGELRETRGGEITNTRPVCCGDIAVLVSNNDQAQAMAEALANCDVPAVVTSGADVFSSDEAQEMRILLRAILEPRRTQRVRAALATRLLGLSATELAELDTPASNSSADPNTGAFSAWIDRFEQWHRTWHAGGLASLLAALEGDQTSPSSGVPQPPFNPVSRRLAVLPLSGERRVTNYRHVTDLLLEASRGEAPQPAELVRWLGQQIARAEVRSEVEERQLQLSTDRAAVHVVTMHKAKGLEYPLVFCPYLADSIKLPQGLLHLPENPGDPANTLFQLEQLAPEARAQREEQRLAAELEERLRLAYVALTRAQVRVWTCSYTPSTAANDHGSPLDWLLRPAADAASYPRYSKDWITALRDVRERTHALALDEISRAAAAEVGPVITVCPPPAPTRRTYRAGSTTAAGPVAAAPAPNVPPGWRVTSFSALTKEKHAHGAVAAIATGAVAPAPTVSVPNTPTLSLTPGPDAQAEFLFTDTTTPSLLGFAAAPGGAAVGTAVHDWLEAWNFSAIDEAALGQHLGFSRLPAVTTSSWSALLTELFDALAQARLPRLDTIPLGQLCSEVHASEWHFHLPLANTVTVADFARCFAEYAAPEHRAYAPTLAGLSEERFSGLLQGFIDRLVRHGAAWGVIDWKTNRLGDTLEDYSAAALLQCAMDDHYLLQVHLYLLALRRYLRSIGVQQPQLAGGWLVFLRAIEPATTRGILHIDPPTAMLDALEELFASPEAQV